jgi:steroid 5-alpha reductase family enzyme
MTTHLGALATFALSLAVLMALASMVQQRAGNSGWADAICTFSEGLSGAGNARWPRAGVPGTRAWLVSAFVALWSLRLGIYLAIRTCRIMFPLPRHLAAGAIP